MIASCSLTCSDLPTQGGGQLGRCHAFGIRQPRRVYNGCLESSSVRKRNVPSQRPCLLTRSVWRDVIDPGSGRTYYWNTETNETTWEKPVQLSDNSTAFRVTDGPSGTSTPVVSNLQILQNLKEAYNADSSGMQFWEVARSHRADGVFEEAFTEFLNNEVVAEPDEEARAFLQKVQARLSNPLLRQAAPFEF